MRPAGFAKRYALAMLLLSTFSTAAIAQNTDPPSRVARLSYLTGKVSFEPSGENQWTDATLNYPVTTGDRIYTDQNSRAELETGNVAVRVGTATDLTATSLTDQLMQLGLAQGSVRLRPYEIFSGSTVEVDTPNVAVTILQPGNYRIDTYPDDGSTLVTVNSGTVELSGQGINQTVHSGQAAKLSGTSAVQISYVDIPSSDAFDQWSGSRDQRFLASTSTPYVNRYTPGYYDLDGYGRWDSEYAEGPIWYPTAVPVGWVPYRYGRWVWVEPWGWTWVDNQPWGFAPFHYGRWAYVGGRWGWCPGPVVLAYRPVYSPALVAFVGGHGFGLGIALGGVQAWFPLGPGEAYYPWYHHSDGYLRQVNVTNVRNVTNITNITNVNNISNVTNIKNVQNNSYVNRKIAITAVTTSTFRSAQPVATHVLRVDAEQVEKAQVLPHPEAAPDFHAAAGGASLTHPPVAVARPVVVQRAAVASFAEHPQSAARNTAARSELVVANRAAVAEPKADRPILVTRNAPPASNSPSTMRADTPTGRGPLATLEGARGGVLVNRPQVDRPQLVTRTTPPPSQPPFAQRQPAIAEHPGRPLEPQQVDNIRQGRPAGPMRDPEVAPHTEHFPKSNPQPQEHHAAPAETHGPAQSAPAASQHPAVKSETGGHPR